MFYIWIGKKFDSSVESKAEAIEAANEIASMGYDSVYVLDDDGNTVYTA